MRSLLPIAVASPCPRPEEIRTIGAPGFGFFVKNALSGRKFLVDTGAFRSLLPATAVERRHSSRTPSNVRLVAANGTDIPLYGTRTVPIQFAGRRFCWEFIVAKVEMPLLGADFPRYYELLVDVANHRLLDLATFHSTSLGSFRRGTRICFVSTGSLYDVFCQDFPDVFRPELRQDPGQQAKHGVFHYIKTTGPPVHSKFRRLSPEKLQAAKQAFGDMERMGVCQ